jgi:hypothetical protein
MMAMTYGYDRLQNEQHPHHSRALQHHALQNRVAQGNVAAP